MPNLEFMKHIKKKDNWATPKDLYDKLDRIFHFDFDPCPLNPTFDGLIVDWYIIRNGVKRGSVFCNPPYSEVEKWIEKGCNEILKENVDTLVFLVYAKTDTRWFHKFIWNNPRINWEIDFIKGRLKFGGKNTAPFPSMLLIYRREKDEEI